MAIERLATARGIALKRYCRQHWKVDRAFSWLTNRRRLDRRLEHGQKAYRAVMRVFFLQHYLKALFS